MDFICLCVRVPKSGSSSLRQMLLEAFADRRTFYLPDTLDFAGRISATQRWQFRQSRIKHLLAHYGTLRMVGAYARINAQAANGDLIAGGHVDYLTARENIWQKLKIVTILRNPAERCRSEYNYARRNYFKKSALTRFDSKLLKIIAGRNTFVGYLDFLLDHQDVYGNIACTYLCWRGTETIAEYFRSNVFHSGVLEENDKFARGLSEKTGKKISFPHENPTVRAEEEEIKIGAEERRRIERLYDRDLELYEWQRRNI